MGLLTVGEPLSWENVEKHIAYVKKHGVLQFLHTYRESKDDVRPDFRWGDEVEYTIVRLDKDGKKTYLSCRAPEIIKELEKESCVGTSTAARLGVDWHPEYANWMLEATPGQAYGAMTSDLVVVEGNLRLRRFCGESTLYSDERLISIPAFPRLGCRNFTSPHYEISPDGPVSKSWYIPDEVIQPHPRFPTLTANIRKRRGSKVAMCVPMYMDANTNPELELPEGAAWPIANDGSPVSQEIYMDAMGFGMGCSCLQITMQARNIGEARDLYDQLAVMAPMMMALSACTPILKGFLAETDVRWDVIAGSVDCRNRAERGLEEVKDGKHQRIQRSRYDNIEAYISAGPLMRDEYNDVDMLVDKDALAMCKEEGIDDLLARHIAHLFIRDPIVVFEERLSQVDDVKEKDHFENLQSTNWNTVRFKPPPPGGKIGWRVEFRSLDISITEFENAAMSVFVILLSRTILALQLNLYIPMSKVEINMRRAHARGAAVKAKYWFRKNIFSKGPCEAVEISNDVLFNGNADFPGLIPLVYKYLDKINCSPEHLAKLKMYLDLLGGRASGKIQTAAEWMRSFVLKHPAYKKDSVVSQEICYDLLTLIDDVQRGAVPAPEFLGAAKIPLAKDVPRRERPADYDDVSGGAAAAGGAAGAGRPCAQPEFQRSTTSPSPSVHARVLRGRSLELDEFELEAIQEQVRVENTPRAPSPKATAAAEDKPSSE